MTYNGSGYCSDAQAKALPAWIRHRGLACADHGTMARQNASPELCRSNGLRGEPLELATSPDRAGHVA